MFLWLVFRRFEINNHRPHSTTHWPFRDRQCWRPCVGFASKPKHCLQIAPDEMRPKKRRDRLKRKPIFCQLNSNRIRIRHRQCLLRLRRPRLLRLSYELLLTAVLCFIVSFISTSMHFRDILCLMYFRYFDFVARRSLCFYCGNSPRIRVGRTGGRAELF